jgi:Plasmid pRiA4b ORF-3-like protein
MPGVDSPTVHQLKIGLEGTTPPLWRRLQIPSAASLGFLHDVIQRTFGWKDYHLHRFHDERGREWGDRESSSRGGFGAAAFANEEEVDLGKVLRAEGSVLWYVYDFGDNWRHRIEVEKVAPLDPAVTYPRCTGGRRAAPRLRTSGGHGDWKRSPTWSPIRRKIRQSTSRISSPACATRAMTRVRSIRRS